MVRVDEKFVVANANFEKVLDHYKISYAIQLRQGTIRTKCLVHKGEDHWLIIDSADNTFKCTAEECGWSGDVIDFVNQMEEMDDRTHAAVATADICKIATAPD